MKVLLDSCVWGGALKEIEAAGHEVEWTGAWNPDPGDEAILAHALSHQQILITLDKDFGDLAIHRGIKHCGILRLVGFSGRQQGLASINILASHGAELMAGAIVTAEPGRMRIRAAPSP